MLSRLSRSSAAIALLSVIAVRLLIAQSPIQYVYDDIGRLIAVIEPSGDTATYTYDAVGNILSIGRHSSSTVSVISFAPSIGPVGTVVTIHGTGFSATANQNAVSFNGTSATVSVASATQLTVTVPGGATTGTIGITAPGGSATSSGSYTVAATGAPTITSFTPTIGLAGTSVTVTGTNFETSALKERARFNITGAATMTATSTTSLSTLVPLNAGSGHIGVKTLTAEVVSADDFFVPPPPYTASDVVYTGRMGFSDSEAVAIGTASKIGMVVFDATAGQKVSVKSVIGPLGSANLYSPTGGLLTSVGSGISGSFIEPFVASTTGTYMVMIDPTGGGTGTTTVTAYNVPADVTGTIATNGTPANLVTTVPGQNALLTFSGTSGHRMSLKVTSGSPAGTAYLRKPDGSTLGTLSVGGIFTSFLEPLTLPTTGTYTVYFDLTGSGVGTTTFTLYDVPADVSGSITPNGSAVGVTISTPGQNGALTFSGTSGHRMSVRVPSGPTGTVFLRKSDLTVLGSVGVPILNTSLLEPVTLPATDTYDVFVDLTSSGTGTETVTLYDIPADLSGTLTVNGSAVGSTITGPGQNGTYTFTGAASQLITVRVTSNTMNVTVKLLKPDGSVLTSTSSSSASFNLTQKTLPTAGTYSVVVDPNTTSTGSLNVAATSP